MTGDKPLDPGRFDDRLSRLYTGEADKKSTYDQWAGEYEQDLVGEMGYIAHVDTVRIFAEAVPERNCRVLDVACGTGLAGTELRKQGYSSIDGTDFSPGMLEKAAATGCYDYLFQHDFTCDPDKPGEYDALICVGLFAFDVPGVNHMIHVIRAVKPGAPCVITVNGAAWREMDYIAGLKAEAEQHGFRIGSIHKAGYIPQQGIDARVLVIRSPQVTGD
jgi:SAM-dependent methyltransferase